MRRNTHCLFSLWSANILLLGILVSSTSALGQYPAQYPTQSQVSKNGTSIIVEDFAALPLSGVAHGGASKPVVDYEEQLGRVNSMLSEPSSAPLSSSRFFVNDMSGTLYILDKKSKQFTSYLNFPSIFPKFVSDAGITAGIISIAFDPNYAKNGKFYTVHIENPTLTGASNATNRNFPSLNLTGYAVSLAVNPPAGPVNLESVLIEWTDTNIRNGSFEGSAREILRIGFDRHHPIGDILFDPLAKSGNSDYGNLYIAVGNGAQGETPGPAHTIPQRLDTLIGKILRITPDINLHPDDLISTNGRYRIPSTGRDPNPFVFIENARPEIYAYGLRNPHRMTWDVPSKAFLFNDIGLHEWEEVNVLVKGANYGYAEREGNERLFVDSAGKTGSLMTPPMPFPDNDRLAVEGLRRAVTPVYPAAVYSHLEGDSIGSGYVYRGKLMSALRGRYIFNDITTGRIFYADLAEMLATHGQRNHQAALHEIQLMTRAPGASSATKARMFDLVAETYVKRGGTPAQDRKLPGTSVATTGWQDREHHQPKADPEGVAYGGGRADVRIAMDGDGELYVLSKSDGMIRKFVAVIIPPPHRK